jgi:hypothetical protein
VILVNDANCRVKLKLRVTDGGRESDLCYKQTYLNVPDDKKLHPKHDMFETVVEHVARSNKLDVNPEYEPAARMS